MLDCTQLSEEQQTSLCYSNNKWYNYKYKNKNMASTEQSLDDEIKGLPISTVVTLTSAQIIAMYTTPVQVVPAVSNKAIVVLGVELIMKGTATQFTGGGVVAVQYADTVNGGGTSVQASTFAASVVTGATATTYSTRPQASLSAVATASINGIGLFISNATAVFATGTGTADVRVTYRVI